jgi:hypothetical protein
MRAAGQTAELDAKTTEANFEEKESPLSEESILVRSEEWVFIVKACTSV